MTLKDLKFKTRKYWLWICLLVTILYVAAAIISDAYGISALWSLLIYIPLILLGFDPTMVLSKGDVKKILLFFLSLVYALIIFALYSKNHSVGDIFSLDTLKALGWLTIFLGGAWLMFGYLPMKILRWKDRKIMSTAVYDSAQAADYIYRKLPDEIAKKTSASEIADILDRFFKLITAPASESFVEYKGNEEKAKKEILGEFSHLTSGDLEKIFALEKEYKKEIGIN